MHRRLAYLLAWSVAATITVSLAWLGIRSVLAAAAPTRTVPLSTAQLRRVAPLPSPGSAAPAGPSSPATAAPSASSPSASSPSTGPASTAAPTRWQPEGDGFTRTFHTLGGDVGFFTAKDMAQVSSSAPKSGYTVNVTRYGVDSVMVSFFGDRKTSRVWVRWWNGPYGEITESVD